MDIAKTVLPGATQTAPMPVVLVGSGDGTAHPFDLTTIAWTGTLASEPPMIGIGVRRSRFSYDLIDGLGCFTVNIPSIAQAKVVDYCGRKSGREVDKIRECGLSVKAGSKVCAPVVMECPLTMECQVRSKVELGSHTLFLGEIVAVQITSGLLDENGNIDFDRAQFLCCANLHYYALGEAVAAYGCSLK